MSDRAFRSHLRRTAPREELVAEIERLDTRVVALLAEKERLREWNAAAEVECERYEKALRKIDTNDDLPEGWDAAEWWKHVASKRREVARAALSGAAATEEQRGYCTCPAGEMGAVAGELHASWCSAAEHGHARAIDERRMEQREQP